MTPHPSRIVGWCCADSMTPAEAAAAAIEVAALVLRANPGLLHYDLATGRVSITGPKAPALPGTFVRGIAYSTDPDVLAEDLFSEAIAARLIRTASQSARAARRAA